MAWFTAGDGYVDQAIGTAVRRKVAPTTASFSNAEARVRAKVKAAYLHSGYSLSDTSPTDLAKSIALALWIKDRYGKQVGMVVDEDTLETASLLNGIWEGTFPDPDADPDTQDAIGGSKFSSTSETATSGRPARMSRSELDSW